MKTLPITPNAEILCRAFKLESKLDSKFETVYSTMAFSGENSSHISGSSGLDSRLFAPDSRSDARSDARSELNGQDTTPTVLDTPSKAPSDQETPSKSINGRLHDSKSPIINGTRFQDSKSAFNSPVTSIPSSTNTPLLESDGWSSAVGRATVGGKSGRVIERLMGDVDKLNRELRYSEAQLQEERLRCESAISSMESLRTTNVNLSTIVESSKLAAQRRDRKMEEFRVELAAEKGRREKAELEKREIATEREATISKMQKELVDAKMQAKEATTRYEILTGCWRDHDQIHRHGIHDLQTKLKEFQTERKSDLKNLDNLDQSLESIKVAQAKTQAANDAVVAEFEAYKTEQEGGLREISSRASNSLVENDLALKEMILTCSEMKHIIKVKENLR